MGFLDTAKKSLVANFNFKEWLGVKTLKQPTNAIYGMYKDLKSGSTSESTPSNAPQSFEELMLRNGITEKELEQRTRKAFAAFSIYFLCFFFVLLYSVYLLIKGHYQTSIFSFVLVIVFLSFVFQEHFKYLQMKHRNLSFTFKDWVRALFKGAAK